MPTTARLPALTLALSAALVTLSCGIGAANDALSEAPRTAAGEVQLSPGMDLPGIVRAASAGTRFVLTPGVYRLSDPLVPRDGQVFIAADPAPGAVTLSGAVVLTGWRQEGGLWVAEHASPGLPPRGTCSSDHPLCREREDLFLDGEMLTRVGSRGSVGEGTWYYDGRRIFVSRDSRGVLAELSVEPHAFRGGGDHVEIRGLTIEKFVPGAQEGALSAKQTRGWKVIDVTARWNHGLGLHLGDRTHVIGGRYNHNGQMGMRSEWGQGTVEGAEIAHNNYAGYDGGWEAGGTKFLEMTKLTIRGTCVHSNIGPGLWTDANNANVLYEDNIVFANLGDGIKHEISYNAVIRNNLVVGNGFAYDPWLWGSQILVQNSTDTVVSGNIAVAGPEGGNGISIIHQERRSPGGRWITARNRIEGNRITLLGGARTGLGADYERDWFWSQSGNRFSGNLYLLPEEGRDFYHMQGKRSLGSAQSRGQEQGSRTARTDAVLPEVSCATPIPKAM